MTDFLLELRSEEIPARMQERARADLETRFVAELAKAGLAASAITTYATPRRLALIAHDLPTGTEAVSEEVKGPPATAPDQAIEGFCRKTGLARDQLETRDVKGRDTLFAVIEQEGRATAEVLAEAIPAVIRAFPWPKTMRWGEASTSTESLRWVRPLHGIVALFGEEVVPFTFAGIASGAATRGHRFHHPGDITIGSAQDYAEKLRACHVVVDGAERRNIIALGAKMAARKAGLTLVEDDGLLAENAGLTEWPVPLLGRFDEAFLDVPPEVIQLTARVNQKYFVCKSSPHAGRGTSEAGGGGAPSGGASADNPLHHQPAAGGSPPRAGEDQLANAFVCTANIDAADGGERIVAGNEKVLAARLADARFFYDTDLKTNLETHAKKLDRIVFHEMLGTVADKVDRVAKLARWLVEEGIILPGTGRGTSEAGGGGSPSGATSADSPLHRPADGPPPLAGEDREELAALAERAARLAKADLVTEMVGEFPELQGLIGGYYAEAQGEDPRVAAAIRDHYKPVGQGDDVPTDPVTVAVSLADKLDTLATFFVGDEQPTGSRDPFALRRAMLALLRIIQENNLRTSFSRLLLLPVQMGEVWFILPMTKLDGSELREAFNRVLRSRTFRLEFLSADEWYLNVDRQEWVVGRFTGSRKGQISDDPQPTTADAFPALEAFAVDRLKVQQREAGVRHDLIDAVFALGGEDDLVRLLARVHALQAFVATEDGTNLLAGYKRAANILKKEGWGHATTAPVTPAKAGVQSPEDSGSQAALDSRLRGNDDGGDRGAGKKTLSYTPEDSEKALMDALESAEPRAAQAVAEEDFEGAMAALASLRAPIDRFFDGVTVNDEDPDKRAARLALLARMRDAVHRVADFSKIEG